VNIVEYDIEKDRSKAQEMFEKSGKRSVPLTSEGEFSCSYVS